MRITASNPIFKFWVTIVFLIFILTNRIDAQNKDSCTCTKELEYVIGYYERNLPGYKDNVTSENEADYKRFKGKLKKEAQNVNSVTSCYKILTYFVEFFKDNHSRISMTFPSIDENDDEAIKIFLNSELFLTRETYDLADNDIRQYPLDDIRGLYQTADSTYTIAIVENKGPFRQYIGVVTNSRSKLWKKGQIKMELNPKDDGSFEAFVYMRNHSLQYNSNFTLENGILGDSWFKTSKNTNLNPVLNYDWSFSVKAIDDQTAYIRIPTFSGYQSAKLDSLYAVAKPIIEKHPFLIIDVRNNGGGSDANVKPLLDYIYTQPLKNDSVDLWVTKDNIAMWERWCEEYKKDTINYTSEDIRWYEEQISLMKNAPLNTFVNRSSGEDLIREINSNKPKKIAILQNKYCASSCETLLFWGMQSTNTILVGENSGGYVGYGEVGNIKTPCFEYDLYTTMTRYKEERKYEVVGISPDYYLDNNEDWLQQTIQLIKDQ